MTLAKSKKEIVSKKLLAALVVALASFMVKGAWNFVSYQVWIGGEVKSLHAKNIEIETHLIDIVRARQRESDQIEHRIENIENHSRGIRYDYGSLGRKNTH